MSSQLWRTLQIKGHDQNYMITKFDNDTIIRFAARHDSFGLNFTRKNRKSEKNPAFRKSELGILPLKKISEIFGSFGAVQSVEIPGGSGLSFTFRHCCFVEYEQTADAAKALKVRLYIRIFKGRVLT